MIGTLSLIPMILCSNDFTIKIVLDGLYFQGRSSSYSSLLVLYVSFATIYAY